MIRNVHERTVAAPAERVGALLDRLGGPDDVVWPVPEWPPLVLDRALAVGAQGGHGIIRYRVALHDPGRLVGFAFDPASGLVGVHSFTVEPSGAGRTRVRHVMQARPVGAMRLLWPLAGRWLHDALTESFLDRVEYAVGLRPRPTERWSPWLRVLRRVSGNSTARRGDRTRMAP
ncbi:SRPBCC family protein [Pseudonocardia abyssalis]|uniref:SRPBCC family protein n=1 Tax=Pseudonocardia abyssalis TaxID=2792008 RepID=A0ABS6UWU4_9PSEU|nr:SRPBCC family protein [Pseudonocardia abyssalis]MBW0115485.1 SRPBCC family protein [Pseudonocardia abyssalis]MBW0136719.1 SRPBCC family protein [Pseudonocardia abyssalis]